MFFFYQLSSKTQDLESRYKKVFSKANPYVENSWVNGFEYPKMPVITNTSEEMLFYEWG